MEYIIETPRLLLREVDAIDADGFLALDSDPMVQRYVGNKPLTNVNEAFKVIQFIQQQYNEFGIGRWSLLLKNEQTFIGWAGFKWVTDVVNGHSHYHDLGYRLMQKHWGYGYATEAAKALVDYAFDHMKLDQINAITDQRNTASHHVLSKIGMELKSIFDYDDIPHHWYELDKPTFLNQLQNLPI